MTSSLSELPLGLDVEFAYSEGSGDTAHLRIFFAWTFAVRIYEKPPFACHMSIALQVNVEDFIIILSSDALYGRLVEKVPTVLPFMAFG